MERKSGTKVKGKVEPGLAFHSLKLDHQPLPSRPRQHWDGFLLFEDLEEAGSEKRLTKAKLL